ncbi:hypothetical protein C8R47DRAFT_1201414 [Mycena vitilis]|nr:hypothetical protein C8R47DRAFT_1201414 [Mycena vitilis]
MSGIPPQLDVGKITIPLFIGTVFNWMLLGVLAVQVYIYTVAFRKDQTVNKLVVTFIFVAELLQTLGDSRNTIETFGFGYGDLASLDAVRWAWFSVPILGSTIACVGQIFFAWRISVIGKTWYIPAVITVITTIQWGGGIWTGIDIIRAGRFSLLHSLKPPFAWLAATALSDLIIVFGTLYYIIKSRDREFKLYRTNIALSRIIKVSVETGVLCAVFAILDLAIYVAFKGDNTHLAVCIWLSKVYSNSIMVILNSRAYIGHAVPPSAPEPKINEMVFHGHSWGAPTSAVYVRSIVDVGRSSTDGTHTHIDSDSDSDSSRSSHTRHSRHSSHTLAHQLDGDKRHSHQLDVDKSHMIAVDKRRGEIDV